MGVVKAKKKESDLGACLGGALKSGVVGLFRVERGETGPWVVLGGGAAAFWGGGWVSVVGNAFW